MPPFLTLRTSYQYPPLTRTSRSVQITMYSVQILCPFRGRFLVYSFLPFYPVICSKCLIITIDTPKAPVRALINDFFSFYHAGKQKTQMSSKIDIQDKCSEPLVIASRSEAIQSFLRRLSCFCLDCRVASSSQRRNCEICDTHRIVSFFARLSPELFFASDWDPVQVFCFFYGFSI